MVIHQLAAKPRAWGESEIRADFPDIVRRWFDERDPDDLAASPKAVSAACRDCSFDAVAKAAAALIETRKPERLHAQGQDTHYAHELDLSVYDRFLDDHE